MENQELKAEMRVLVDFESVPQPAKVIGPVVEKRGNEVKIIGWKLHVGTSALEYTATADKIFPTLEYFWGGDSKSLRSREVV